ncbi:DUF948 domain-containing protein [Candidatus Solincola tengchongensis]|uniref:DUF948 domain-containing protein n=1 Tax=Candidatus Solincola tengchongensis TaxID=2900693 RepID=UPI00257AD906|nr:DUF948 domain-containing protein [Candidatus Solincola tengchongensis]
MGGLAALICAASFALFMLSLAAVAWKLYHTMAVTNRILDDIRRETLPLLGKLQTTMDHVNREMEYVDGVLEAVGGLASRLDSMTAALQQLVTSPLVRFLSLGIGARRALGERARREDEGKD